MKLKTRMMFAICYLVAACAATFPMMSFFWPSLVGVFFVSFAFAPYMLANNTWSLIIKSLYFAVIVPGFGLLCGGVLHTILSLMTSKESFDIWSLIGSQLAFGSMGSLLILPIAVIAYFVANYMKKLRLFNGI